MNSFLQTHREFGKYSRLKTDRHRTIASMFTLSERIFMRGAEESHQASIGNPNAKKRMRKGTAPYGEL